MILTFDLDQILKFKNETSIHTFLKKHAHDFDLSAIEVHAIGLLIYYHLDIIVAIHTIKSLYNPVLSLTHKNIDYMLSAH